MYSSLDTDARASRGVRWGRVVELRRAYEVPVAAGAKRFLDAVEGHRHDGLAREVLLERAGVAARAHAHRARDRGGQGRFGAVHRLWTLCFHNAQHPAKNRDRAHIDRLTE